MFQLPADNAAYGNVVADAVHASPQAADTADDKVYFNARHGSFIQFLNNGVVNQRVHFGNDMPGAAFFNNADFVVDKFINLFAQSERRHNQFVPYRRVRITGQHIEERRSVAAELVVGSHQAHIGIKFGCVIVVVACAKMHIALNAVCFLAHNQNNFGVGFKAHQAVNYVAACFFKPACPDNIVFFIKARF